MPLPHAPLRPRLAFRVGITGARPNKLDEKAIPLLRAAVAATIRLVRRKIEEMAEEQKVRAAYGPGAPLIRLISPLAEGSDRIAAEAALAEGIRLEVPMPFSPEEYEKTFAADSPPWTEGFEALLAAARTEQGSPAALALDGRLDADPEAAYRAVGRFVVRNSDLLLAIWDGKPGKPGGTAEIVHYAARSHVPIWWIDAGGKEPPRFLSGVAAFERRASAPSGEAAEAALQALVRGAIVPPAADRPHHHTWVGACVHLLAAWFGRRRDPLSTYFAEADEEVRPRRWRVYSWALDGIAPPRGTPSAVLPVGPAEPADAVESVWAGIYGTADRHGGKYADRYRSSYVLIILLAAFTLSAMGLALALPRLLGLPATCVEFLALLRILSIVAASELGSWHERWIEYRLLAELCRKQRMLARLGWPLPLAQVAEVTRDPEAEAPPRDAWLAWYVAAIVRGAALPHGKIADHVPRARFLGEAMIATQTDYHRRRAERSGTAARRLVCLGELLFVATVILVGLKLWFLLSALWNSHLALTEGNITGRWVGVACTTFAAFSAGFVSLRAYAEFDLLHLQSERMLRVLADAEEELEAVDMAAALASQSLGAVLHGLALAMLQDVQGWSLLFRTKTPETS